MGSNMNQGIHRGRVGTSRLEELSVTLIVMVTLIKVMNGAAAN